MSIKKSAFFHFIFLILFLTGFFGFTSLSAVGEENLIISEIMYDPAGSDSGHTDWIEIYNPTGGNIVIKKEDFGLIDEKELKIGKDGVHYLNCHKIKGDLSLESKKFVILADNDGEFKADYPGTAAAIIDSTFSLSSDGDTIYLSPDKCATFFTELNYESSWGGKDNGFTLEKINLDNNEDETNWQESYVPGGTPGEKNSEKPKPKEYSRNIFFNELFPNPFNENDEYIELYNSSDETVELESWTLRDASKTGKYVLPADAEMESGGYLAIYKKDSKLSLNNSGEEIVYLYNPDEKLTDKVAYSGSKESKSYSFDGKKWRWSQYLTPGEDNLFNNLPIVSSKKENEIYVGVYAQFSAKANDKDKEKLKFTWDFGDGHKSYLQNTRHKYEKIGDYTATLKVTDGNEDVFKTFKIKVVKFPKIKLSIKEIMPNPKGLDTKEGGEYLVIKNESDKKINLKGWSIATGSKNLYNHPITKDFILKKVQSKKLTRKYSKFALINTKGKIEIRYPNGKMAYKLKYEKDKIADDEIYKKVNGKWQWIAPPTESKLATTENPAENISVAAIEYKDTEIQNNLGKYSESASWRTRVANRIVLANYATNLNLPNNLNAQPRVLGASTVRDDSEYFSFGRPYVPEPHWFVKFLENIAGTGNLLLNKFILLFN